MLKFLKLNKSSNKKVHINEEIKSSKHFPSSIREWKNSIYLYNKNAINLIPSSSKTAIALIKSYFSLFNKKIEDKIRTKRLLLKFKRLCSDKIFISKGEFKHTNNKVTITLYLFNRQKYNYLLFLKKFYLRTIFSTKNLRNKKIKFETYFFYLLKSIENKGLKTLIKVNKEKYMLIKILSKLKKKNNKYISLYVNNFYKKLLSIWFIKLQLYLYYRQLIFINRSKFNYTYLQYIKKYVENVYNKNIEFNLVNLKRFYLNSDILTESITSKITRNRRRLFIYMNLFKNKIKPQIKKILLNENITYTNLNINKNLSLNNKLFITSIINKLKYRNLTGFRLEAKGRLTRRHTASRSISELIYKGNLLGIDSSYRKLSSVLLKGNLKSNLQYTKLSSKNRIGSFGMKGWVSGN